MSDDDESGSSLCDRWNVGARAQEYGCIGEWASSSQKSGLMRAPQSSAVPRGL